MSTWWKEYERKREEHRDAVAMGAWRAGLGDQHPDEVSRAYERGVSPDRFVRERVEARAAARRAEEERVEEQRRLESTCQHEDVGGPCWGPVEHLGYNAYACRAHARVDEGVYLDDDEVEHPIEE